MKATCRFKVRILPIERPVVSVSGHGGHGLGLTPPKPVNRAVEISGLSRIRQRPNWLFCDAEPRELGIHEAALTRQGSVTLSRRSCKL